MNGMHRLLWPALLLASLTGCALAPRPVAVAATPVPIAVSCKTDSMTDEPCLAMARQACPQAAVDTIHLVLAKTDGGAEHPGKTYDYRATYSCFGNVRRANAP